MRHRQHAVALRGEGFHIGFERGGRFGTQRRNGVRRAFGSMQERLPLLEEGFGAFGGGVERLELLTQAEVRRDAALRRPCQNRQIERVLRGGVARHRRQAEQLVFAEAA